MRQISRAVFLACAFAAVLGWPNDAGAAKHAPKKQEKKPAPSESAYKGEGTCDNPPKPRPASKYYPSGADIITCQKTADGEKWVIKQPWISSPMTSYPAIRFLRGDVITLLASGCANRGGHGTTWESYAAPKQGNDTEHFGRVFIKGVTPGDSRLQHWMGVPLKISHEAHLLLGYHDGPGIKAYEDNGYQKPDSGKDKSCKSEREAEVTILIRHGSPASAVCNQPQESGTQPAGPVSPALAKVQQALAHAEIDLGKVASPDQPAGGLTHFQHFGVSGQPKGSLNSVEMHPDGCIYVAYTEPKSPWWYPVDYAFDAKGWSDLPARPFDAHLTGQHGNRSGTRQINFEDLQSLNRTPLDSSTVDGKFANNVFTPAKFNQGTKPVWGDSFKRAECGGAPGPSRGTSPRWIKICTDPKGEPLPRDIHALAPTAPAAHQSGKRCSWQHLSQSIGNTWAVHEEKKCGVIMKEWTPYHDESPRTAEGIITASFLSGGDLNIDHSGMPKSWWRGVHEDGDMHNQAVGGTQTCGPDDIGEINHGELCSDWEANVYLDPPFRKLLAPIESGLNDQADKNKPCKGEKEYRVGNFAGDMKGNLGLEIEQWAMVNGYRPEPGDRAHVVGRYIVDCGHPSWQTELHPLHLITSSYLQTDDVYPTIALTRNLPPIVHRWKHLTGGAQANVTKVLLTQWWFEDAIEFDVWAPARPTAGSRLQFQREAPAEKDAIKNVEIIEAPEPRDNPNHLHVKVVRKGKGPQGPKPVSSSPRVAHNIGVQIASLGTSNLVSMNMGEIAPNSNAWMATAYLVWWK